MYCINCGQPEASRSPVPPEVKHDGFCLKCSNTYPVANNYNAVTGELVVPLGVANEPPTGIYKQLLKGIRQIVREEIRQALADDTEEPEPDYKPRLITIESKPRLWVKFQRDGVLYAGHVPAVEEKWGSE